MSSLPLPSRRQALVTLVGLVGCSAPTAAPAAVGLFVDVSKTGAPRGVVEFRTLGYRRPGLAAGLYRQVADRGQPQTRFRIRLRDGRLFELAPDDEGFVTALQLGAIGDGQTDDEPALNAGLAYFRKIRLETPSAAYLVRTGLRVPSNGALVGAEGGVIIRGGPGRKPLDPVVGNMTTRPRSQRERDVTQVYRNLILDGNKARNAGQGEGGHGLFLRAVDDVLIENVRAVDCQGDGLCLSMGYSPELSASRTFCTRVRGDFRSERAERQGVAIIAASDVDLELSTYRSRLYGFDIEPDNGENIVENITVRLTSLEDGDGSQSAGGLAVYGAGQSHARNVSVTFDVTRPNGYGVVVRQASGYRLSGTVRSAAAAAFFAPGSALPSDGAFDITVEGGSTGGVFRSLDSGKLNGRFSVAGPVRTDSTAVVIENASGGRIDLRLPDGGQGQGLALQNVNGLTVRGVIQNFASYGVWLRGANQDNLFDGVTLTQNNRRGFVESIKEEPGGANNRFNGVALGRADRVALQGRRSSLSRR